MSPGYGSDSSDPAASYPNNTNCKIRMNNNALLTVVHFGLEFGYDHLQVTDGSVGGSMNYSGYTITAAPSSEDGFDGVPGWSSVGKTVRTVDRGTFASIPEQFSVQTGNTLTFSSDSSVSGA
eukprot:9369286-Pyramimonas_sp.AAC.1